MELIYVNERGDTFRLVYTSESRMSMFASGHTKLGNSALNKHWPRVTRLKMYVNENLADQTKAKCDSRDTDNKDYGMWVCTKKMLLYTKISELISKEDRTGIWREFFKSVNIFKL